MSYEVCTILREIAEGSRMEARRGGPNMARPRVATWIRLERARTGPRAQRPAALAFPVADPLEHREAVRPMLVVQVENDERL